jgi:hypothetical protein
MCDRVALLEILGHIIDIGIEGAFPVIMTVSEADSEFVSFVKKNGILLHPALSVSFIRCIVLMVLMLCFCFCFSGIRLWSVVTIGVGSFSRAHRVRH